MVSDFIVQHPSSPFFQLYEAEYAKAILKYPILETNSHLFLKRSATRFIELNGENYFDNETILEQFERLFILLEFKEDFFYHEIDILVDNATTHTAKAFKLHEFRKSKSIHNLNSRKINKM